MTTVYLVPCFLAEEAKETIPLYIIDAVRQCQVIFAENERTTRRFLKSMDNSINIDDFEWHTIHKTETEQINNLKTAIKQGKNIAIVSEAGCPGIADPGQTLIATAQELNCRIKPLVGPSSILLALMASGMNGQQFEFAGYLPIDHAERLKKIKSLEADSLKNNSTKICIGINITGKEEKIETKTVAQWKKTKPELHKIPVIFLIQA